MTRRNRRSVLRGLLLQAAVVFISGAGCALRGSSRAERPAVVPARIYAAYRFDSSPDVLNLGIQPLWIPTCILWEVMARDTRLQNDVLRAHCRLAPYGFFKGQDLNDFLLAGKLQGGIVGDLPALNMATRREIRIVSLVQQGPCSIIARERLPMADLRGRRIGYAPGSNAHYALLQALEDVGLHPRDVKLVPMDALQMASALSSRRIDAFSAWEPTPTLAMLDHPNYEVLAQRDSRGFLYFTRRFADRHPDAVRAVLASEIRALRWLRMNEKNLYIACQWAYDRAQTFGGNTQPLTVYDFLRLARRDLLGIPTAPQLPADLLASGGELDRQFHMSKRWGLLPPQADWNRVRQSFAMEEVPRLLSEARQFSLDDLQLTPAP